MPPPFVIPFYVRALVDGDLVAKADHEYAVNTLSLATVATLVAFVVSVVYAS